MSQIYKLDCSSVSPRLRFGGTQRIRVYLAVLTLLLYVFTKISVSDHHHRRNPKVEG